MSMTLLGFGTAVPPGSLNQEESLACAKALADSSEIHTSTLERIYRHSEVRTRHQILGRSLVDDLISGSRTSGSPFLPSTGRGPTTAERMEIYDQEASKLAIAAARDALAEAACSPDEITHLITVSCTGFAAPGFDLSLIHEIGLRPTIERVHVGFMGCHGALNGLRVALAFANASPSARVLLCAVELCSLHYNYGRDLDKVVANALFADGAAAVVGVPDSIRSPRVIATGSCLIPNTTELMSWKIGDAGFEMSLSRQVPALIAQHLRPWLEKWLAAHGKSIDNISNWAIHPGGPKILTSVGETLLLPDGALDFSREVFAAYGNMSSPTVLFILKKLHDLNRHGLTVALAFGPGLTAEAVLLE